MVEVVFAFKAHDQRRIAVMLENGGGGKSGLKAMHHAPAQRTLGRQQCLAFFLAVIGEAAQIKLHLLRRFQLF